jgi:hypothetical protein
MIKGNRPALLIGLLAGCAILCLPFMPHLQSMLFTLGVYLQNWEFSNFAFRALRNVTSSGGTARIVLAVLLVASILFFTLSFRERSRTSDKAESSMLLFQTLYGITFCFLLLTPTLYPWYALYLVGLFPFTTGIAGLVLSWVVFLSYHVLIEYSLLSFWKESNAISAAIWLSPPLSYMVVYAVKHLSRDRVPTPCL